MPLKSFTAMHEGCYWSSSNQTVAVISSLPIVGFKTDRVPSRRRHSATLRPALTDPPLCRVNNHQGAVCVDHLNSIVPWTLAPPINHSSSSVLGEPNCTPSCDDGEAHAFVAECARRLALRRFFLTCLLVFRQKLHYTGPREPKRAMSSILREFPYSPKSPCGPAF